MTRMLNLHNVSKARKAKYTQVNELFVWELRNQFRDWFVQRQDPYALIRAVKEEALR